MGDEVDGVLLEQKEVSFGKAPKKKKKNVAEATSANNSPLFISAQGQSDQFSFEWCAFLPFFTYTRKRTTQWYMHV